MEVTLRMNYPGLFKRSNHFVDIWPSIVLSSSMPARSKGLPRYTWPGKEKGTKSGMEKNTGASEEKWTSSQL